MNYEVKKIQGELLNNIVELRVAYEEVIKSYIESEKGLVSYLREWKSIAESLWSLLDDIDTSSDIRKPTIEKPQSLLGFYKQALEYADKRFNYLKSDGYGLYTPSEFEKLPNKSEGQCLKSVREPPANTCRSTSEESCQTYNAG
jgi:hypothetical protein